MKKTLLKSKLHRISVTQVELDYEGSCAVDKKFLELAGMQEYEKVEVYNVTNGERFSTYLILAEAGSKTLSVNGAAAHKASVDDVVIICTYCRELVLISYIDFCPIVGPFHNPTKMLFSNHHMHL